MNANQIELNHIQPKTKSSIFKCYPSRQSEEKKILHYYIYILI